MRKIRRNIYRWRLKLAPRSLVTVKTNTYIPIYVRISGIKMDFCGDILISGILIQDFSKWFCLKKNKGEK